MYYYILHTTLVPTLLCSLGFCECVCSHSKKMTKGKCKELDQTVHVTDLLPHSTVWKEGMRLPPYNHTTSWGQLIFNSGYSVYYFLFLVISVYLMVYIYFDLNPDVLAGSINWATLDEHSKKSRLRH